MDECGSAAGAGAWCMDEGCSRCWGCRRKTGCTKEPWRSGFSGLVFVSVSAGWCLITVSWHERGVAALKVPSRDMRKRRIIGHLQGDLRGKRAGQVGEGGGMRPVPEDKGNMHGAGSATYVYFVNHRHVGGAAMILMHGGYIYCHD